MLGRRRFGSIVDAQLDLFEREHGHLIAEAAESLDTYNRSGRDEAESRYGDYVDAVAAAREQLADMRDHYASTLDDDEPYVRAFDRAVKRRFPRFAFEREL